MTSPSFTTYPTIPGRFSTSSIETGSNSTSVITFMNTGFRIDVSYNEATDVLTFSPNGDYVRVKPQPGHPTEE